MSGHWHILRTTDGIEGDWMGDYKSAEDALIVLQKELEAVTADPDK
jgi:hypothetical protein